MTALLDVAGLLLALAVTGILWMAMAAGVNGATHDCDQFVQQAAGIEWVCQKSIR